MKKGIFILYFIVITIIFGKDIRISLAEIPFMSDNKETGLYFKMIKEMNNYYDDGEIVITGVYPFKRSIHNVINGDVDAHFPLLRNPEISVDSLPYSYSTSKIYQVIFVIYSNKNKDKIDMESLSKYTIETDLAHVNLFNFPIKGSTSIDKSLNLVNIGRSDGWIYAQFITDDAIKKNNYTNLRKQFYRNFDVVFVLPKGEKGRETDKILSEIIDKMHEDGSIKRIFGEYYERKFKE